MVGTAQQPGVRKYAQKYNLLDRISPTRALIVLAIAGLALRIFFLRYRYAVAFDEVNYLKLGVNGSLHGLSEVLHTYWSPLLPTFILFFSSLFPDYEFAARMVSVIAGTVLVFPVYAIAKQVFDERVGVLAAGFVALFPPLAFQTTQILTEPLLMLFGAFSLLFGLKMLSSYSAGYAFFTSVFAGLAYLAHPLGISFLVLPFGWLLLAAISRSFLVRPLRLLFLLPALLFGFLLVSAPYLLFLKNTTGAWTLSAKGAANQQMSTPLNGQKSTFRALDEANQIVPIDLIFHQGTFLEKSSAGAKPVREVRAGPFLVKFVKNFANVLQRAVPQVLTTLPLMLLGIGVFGTAWPVQKTKYILFLLSYLVFFWLVLVPAFHIHLRYLSPMWPVCALFIGQGMLVVHTWLSDYMPITKRTWKKKFSASAVAAILALGILFCLSFLPEFARVTARPINSMEYVADAVEQKMAGIWLRQNSITTPVIMSRNHAIDFYAGNYDIVQSVTVPTNTLERVVAYAHHRKVTHLVLNERYLRDYPQLELLLSGTESNEQLRLVYKEVDVNGLVTVIYEVL